MYKGPKLFNIYLFQWTTCYDFLKILFIMYLYINDKFLLFMMDILFSSVIYFLTFVNNKYEVCLHGFPFELRQLMSESQTLNHTKHQIHLGNIVQPGAGRSYEFGLFINATSRKQKDKLLLNVPGTYCRYLQQ